MIQGKKLLNLADFSLIGCRSGKSTPNMLHSTQAQSSPLTAQEVQFFTKLEPLAFREVTKQAALSRVTVELWSHQAISDALTVRTTFLTLTRMKHYRGVTLARHSLDSPYFRLAFNCTSICAGRFSMTTDGEILFTGQVLAELLQITNNFQRKSNILTFPVLTSQRIIRAEALPLPVPSFAQYREKRYHA